MFGCILNSQWSQKSAGWATFPIVFPQAIFNITTAEYYTSHHGENSNIYNWQLNGFSSDRYYISYKALGI